MSQEDPQQSERAASPRFSRDTLLLLGALAFLILAIALTFLFNTGGNEVSDSGPTPGATSGQPAGGTSPAAYPEPTVGAVVSTAPGTGGYPGPAGGAATSAAYPGPGGIEPPGSPTTIAFPTPALPPGTADPLATPSELDLTPAAGEEATPATGDDPYPIDGQGEDDGAYPAPEGPAPAQPTFNPTVVTPTTAAPPPAAPTRAQQEPTATLPLAPTPEPPSPTEEPEDPVVEATSVPVEGPKEPPPTAAPPPPTIPPPPPADVLRGNVRWASNQSPIILRRDVQIAPGAELIIEPGVEVRLDPGISIYVDGGRLLALGLPDRPVRFIGNTGARWSGIYGLQNSFIAMEHTEIRGGGVGGTVMAIERGGLVMRNSKVNNNGGAILLTDTRIEMLDSEIAGNDMPYGAALDASFSRGNFVTLRGNRIAGNILSEGAPMVRLTNQSNLDTLNLDIDRNLFRGGEANLQLVTNGPLKGAVVCNALVGERLGFSLRTQTLQVGVNGTPPMDLRLVNNTIDEHTPPIIPVYLDYGIGRGATSEIRIDMSNNWWGDASGPYEPDVNPLGRGDSVGSNIIFGPWLTQPSPCAPTR